MNAWRWPQQEPDGGKSYRDCNFRAMLLTLNWMLPERVTSAFCGKDVALCQSRKYSVFSLSVHSSPVIFQ